MPSDCELIEEPGRRWIVLAAAIVIQVPLGGVQAWSVFRTPLAEVYGWSIPAVTLAYTIAHVTAFGFASFVGGLWLSRISPRTVVVWAGVLHGLGLVGAGHSAGSLWLLYLTYGVIAGLGRGFGYIVPLTIVIRWFPDRRGMVTAAVAVAYAVGALVTAPLAASLIGWLGITWTFTILGSMSLVIVVTAAGFMRNPPADDFATKAPALAHSAEQSPAASSTVRAAFATRELYLLWAIFFLLQAPGQALLSQAAPMAHEITGVDELASAGLVSLAAIGSIAGRFLWGPVSDWTGRPMTLMAQLAAQALAFVLLPLTSQYPIFAILVGVVFLTFGGGMSTMPAFTADCFGAARVGALYGFVLTASAIGGIVGPLLIANVREATGLYGPALHGIAAILVATFLLPLVFRFRTSEATAT